MLCKCRAPGGSIRRCLCPAAKTRVTPTACTEKARGEAKRNPGSAAQSSPPPQRGGRTGQPRCSRRGRPDAKRPARRPGAQQPVALHSARGMPQPQPAVLPAATGDRSRSGCAQRKSSWPGPSGLGLLGGAPPTQGDASLALGWYRTRRWRSGRRDGPCHPQSLPGGALTRRRYEERVRAPELLTVLASAVSGFCFFQTRGRLGP